MKIVVITGSAHKNGTQNCLAENFIKGASETGHEIYRFDAAFKNVHPCIGCDHCYKTGDGCVFKDDMMELNHKLIEADAVVFVSPIFITISMPRSRLSLTVFMRMMKNSTEIRKRHSLLLWPMTRWLLQKLQIFG